MKKYLLIMTLIRLGMLLSGCNNFLSNINNDSQGKIIIDKQTDQTEEENELQAQETLVSFFRYLSNQDFENALPLFESDESNDFWERFKDFTPPEDRNDKAKILQNYCQATNTCLKANVIQTQKEDNDTYNLIVQFQNIDGSIFVLGPCCGSTEEEMPSKDQFEFKVKRIDNVLKVTTPPIYVP